MIDEKNTAPISPPNSPPNSPRMSEAPGKLSEYQWQYPPIIAHSPTTASQQQVQSTPREHEQLKQSLSDTSRPSSRLHRSHPHTVNNTGRLQHDLDRSPFDAPALISYSQRHEGLQLTGSANLPPPTFSGSVPNSPTGRLTPNSPGAGPNDEQLEDEDIGFGSGEQDEEEGRPPMTAAELRAHKRKMKRFR